MGRENDDYRPTLCMMTSRTTDDYEGNGSSWCSGIIEPFLFGWGNRETQVGSFSGLLQQPL